MTLQQGRRWQDRPSEAKYKGRRFGDWRQELVFIGQNMRQEEIRRALDGALVPEQIADKLADKFVLGAPSGEEGPHNGGVTIGVGTDSRKRTRHNHTLSFDVTSPSRCVHLRPQPSRVRFNPLAEEAQFLHANSSAGHPLESLCRLMFLRRISGRRAFEGFL
ncbi:unnamed protein product [Prorocentrum cordatum]|uniref:CobW C-terminal domain-containing protein n=1 Tax=Prorocentrum cordatum TaxID=2364126 RepID=A0ABN9SSP8_9DINO|nr:unnamed protein product [Polarella glacialis]